MNIIVSTYHLISSSYYISYCQRSQLSSDIFNRQTIMDKTSGKRTSRTIIEKIQVINSLENGDTNKNVCERFGLSHITVCGWWKNRDGIKEEYEQNNLRMKRRKISSYLQIDSALIKWFQYQRHANIPLNAPILQIQAKKFARVTQNSGLGVFSSLDHSFRTRHNITFGKVSGEENSVDTLIVDTWLNEEVTLQRVLEMQTHK